MLLLSGDLDADEPRQPNDLDFDPRGQGSAFWSQHAPCEAIRHFSCEGKLYSAYFEAFFLATGLFSNLSNNGSVILRQSGIGHSTQLEEMIFQSFWKLSSEESHHRMRRGSQTFAWVWLFYGWATYLFLLHPFRRSVCYKMILSYQRHICHICYQQM